MRASVIVPVLNSSDSLCKLLGALTQQHVSFEFEVIVVDDGSTEPLKGVVERFVDSLDLHFIRLEQNSGPATARNAGIRKAKGEITVFTDADCVPQSDWLEKMVAPFDDAEVVATKGVYRTRQTDIWARLAQIEFLERYEVLESFKDIDFIDTYSGAYRTLSLIEANGFKTDFPANEDVELSFRIKQAGQKFVFVKDAIVFHQHREGCFNYARLKYWRGYWRMKVYSSFPEKIAGDTYTPLSLKLQLALSVLMPFLILFKTTRNLLKISWLFSCKELIRIAFVNDPALILWVPVFCLVRSFSLFAGIMAGLVAEKGECLRRLCQFQNF